MVRFIYGGVKLHQTIYRQHNHSFSRDPHVRRTLTLAG